MKTDIVKHTIYSVARVLGIYLIIKLSFLLQSFQSKLAWNNFFQQQKKTFLDVKPNFKIVLKRENRLKSYF